MLTVSPQSSHTTVVEPATVHVASTVVVVVLICPVAGTSSCATRTSLHTEQCLPSVRPGAVHVGATAVSTTIS